MKIEFYNIRDIDNFQRGTSIKIMNCRTNNSHPNDVITALWFCIHELVVFAEKIGIMVVGSRANDAPVLTIIKFQFLLNICHRITGTSISFF